jgi:hypothetical protein
MYLLLLFEIIEILSLLRKKYGIAFGSLPLFSHYSICFKELESAIAIEFSNQLIVTVIKKIQNINIWNPREIYSDIRNIFGNRNKLTIGKLKVPRHRTELLIRVKIPNDIGTSINNTVIIILNSFQAVECSGRTFRDDLLSRLQRKIFKIS